MENQTPENSPFERMKKDEQYTVWGGYKTNSHIKLLSWIGVGCLVALIAFLLISGLAVAIFTQFASMVMPR